MKKRLCKIWEVGVGGAGQMRCIMGDVQVAYAVVDPGEGPAPPPLSFTPNWRLPPPPFLRVWLTTPPPPPPPYLKVWICHWYVR